MTSIVCRQMGRLQVFVLLALISFAAPALALPAPMSDQDLLEKSDLVAKVKVLSVTCTSITKDEKTGEDLPGYLAQLKVLDVEKGNAKRGQEVLVTWRAVPKGIVGPWTVYYYPGEEVVTHLTKRSGGVSYASTWWNAKGDDIKGPDTKELPLVPGQSVLAKPEQLEQTPL